MYFLEERIGRILEELQQCINIKPLPINEYSYQHTDSNVPEHPSLDVTNWDRFNECDTWGGKREYFWFVANIKIPEDYHGKCVAFDLITGKEMGWEGLNPQFFAFVNGNLIQGMDINHRSIILTDNAKKGENIQLALHAYASDEDNYNMKMQGHISIVDIKIEKLYYDMKVAYDVAVLLPKDNNDHIDMIEIINDTINLLDLRQHYSNEFYRSIDSAQSYLTKELYEKMCKPGQVQVNCIGHSHIDIAWLWTLGVTRKKVARSFSTFLELMKRYPDFIYMSSQPQLYKYVKEEFPELYAQIKQRVKEGRWEAEGGMFVEADCNLSSGESLVRQFLYGKRFFYKEFGVDNEVLWLPDVFGYSAALPQICKKSGIKYFVTTKISWNEYNKLPYDTFEWQGIDGTKILTHFIPTSEYKPVMDTHFTTYNGEIKPSQIMGSWQRYQQKDLNRDVLFSFGYGDGGGGPTPEMLENEKRMSQGIPGCPTVKITKSRDFFHKLERDVKDNKHLPTWSGELYLEYHRGTYTTMARNKKYNRKSEFMYQNAELYSVVNNLLTGVRYPREVISNGWEVILRNQFHDILPGSAIKEVYDESRDEYEGILSEGTKIIDRAINSVASEVNVNAASVIVFNPQGAVCSDIVSFTLPQGKKDISILDTCTNKVYPCQICDNNQAIFFAEGVPAKGYKAFIINEYALQVEDITITKESMINDFFNIKLDDKGQFTSIFDKRANREVLKKGEKGNVLEAFEDKPYNWDAWDINAYYQEKMWYVDEVKSIKVIQVGPVRVCLEIIKCFQQSTITQHIFLYKDLARIDIKNNIDWRAKQILLKAAFPIDVFAQEGTFDIQYGNVKRPTHRNTSWDVARFEVCAHKWADLSEDGYGVSLLNDCKYGCDINNSVMRLSLLKSSVYPNTQADIELHEFTYSLYPHVGGWREGGTVKEAYKLNNPFFSVVRTAQKGSLPVNYSLASVDKVNIIIEVIKKAEDDDDMIIRLYECYNRRTTATVLLGVNANYVIECDLMENKISNLVVKNNKSFTFEIKPYEIKTFKIKVVVGAQ